MEQNFIEQEKKLSYQRLVTHKKMQVVSDTMCFPPFLLEAWRRKQSQSLRYGACGVNEYSPQTLAAN